MAEMTRVSSELAAADEARVRSVYAQRQSAADARYSCFNPGQLFILQERERRVLSILQRFGAGALATKQILEIGCGSGHWLRDFVRWGARPENLTGIDLLPERIAEARRLCPAGVRLQCGSAAQLPWPTGRFDLVLQSTVFTSVLDADVRRQVAVEMVRVLRPGGLIIWYDFHVNNPRNVHVRAVTRRELQALFPGCRIHRERLTLAPPLVRAVAPCSWLVSHVLSATRWLCTHHLAVIRQL
jgi:SAM-dependent methyltransferase